MKNVIKISMLFAVFFMASNLMAQDKTSTKSNSVDASKMEIKKIDPKVQKVEASKKKSSKSSKQRQSVPVRKQYLDSKEMKM
jgi:hypothetical protein